MEIGYKVCELCMHSGRYICKKCGDCGRVFQNGVLIRNDAMDPERGEQDG